MSRDNKSVKEKNEQSLRKIALIALLMFGFGFLLVPFYRVVCRATGINGTVDLTASGQKAAQANIPAAVDRSRIVTVQFTTTINGAGFWQLKSKLKSIRVHPGEMKQVDFVAKNLTAEPRMFQAVPSITPSPTAPFFHKIQCFCFERQEFKPKQTQILSLKFYIEPTLPRQYKTVTLSYTVFDITDQKPTQNTTNGQKAS